MKPRLCWASLLVLMLVGHTLFFVGYTVSDDSLYLSQALRYLAGDYTPPIWHWGFRYTVVIPLTLLGMVSTYNDWLLSTIPLAYWIGLLWLVIWFTQQTIGHKQSLYAGLLIATLPLLVVQSTILGVDIAEAFFLFSAFVVFYRADTAEAPTYRQYFFAGILLGFAMLTRETAYGFVLVLALFFLLGGYKRWRFYLIGLVGVLAVLSLEWAYFLAFNHSLLYRYETIALTHGSVGIRSGDFSTGSGNISDNRIFGPILAVLFNQEFALLYWAALGAAVYLFYLGEPAQRRLLRYIAITFIVYFIWIGYSGAIRPLPRYFSFLCVLAVLLVAMMLAQLQRPLVRNLLLITIIGANFLALSVENIYPRFASRTVSNFVLHSDKAIVTNETTASLAQGYIKMAGGNTALVSDQPPQSGTFVYVAIDGIEALNELKPLLVKQVLIAEYQPPKLVFGHLLDLSGLGRLLPTKLYRYLAIRNPVVHFYKVSI